jgi:hypothetical protein
MGTPEKYVHASRPTSGKRDAGVKRFNSELSLALVHGRGARKWPSRIDEMEKASGLFREEALPTACHQLR